ncbi:KICSTOR complex protein szt2 [Desmophyllum pertusum]|uniref:KICSTOR complex protein szt2 n=1 Tax=Desmophyllum pertusum TaxID=174260 RepID=A0A9W9ZRE3_9CNID|nr:KICSTOR complex protein szt2 [Desmophyllum pertusum]
MVQFAIWERGDIGIDQLAGQLELTLRHALCDLLAEYYLLAAPLSKVPQMYWRSSITRSRSSSAPPSPLPLTPKGPKLGSLTSSEKSSKRQLDFGSQSGFRSRAASFAGHRRTPSAGSHHSTPSSGSTGAPGRTQQNPFLSQRQSVSSLGMVSRQSTVEDEVFQTEAVSPGAVSPGEEAMEISFEGRRSDAQEITESPAKPLEGFVRLEEVKTDDVTPSKDKTAKTTNELKKQERSDPSSTTTTTTASDVEPFPTFETFTAAEIQESQEFTSQPGTPAGTPVSENITFLPKKEELQLPERDNPPSLSSVGFTSGSKGFSFGGADSLSVGQSSDGPSTWQDIEARRRKEEDKQKRRLQFENGERGELHPSLQGLGQDMFSFFRDLGVPSVYCVEGKLINNFASDAFLAELSGLISHLCSDMKPKIYRESPLDSTDGKDSDYPQDLHCLHYYPARQPLKVQDMDESTADKSGKPFTALPNSSHFFVVVGRNVDQWRASLGLEEDLSQEDALGRPRIRTGLQRFKPLDPNAPVPGRMLPDNVSLSSLSVGGVPRQKFLLVTILDKDVTAFTYNWAADLNLTFHKQLHRLLNWSNARCHLTSCLLSQKMGLFHHTLFADINKGKEGKDMNPFCLSANDKDMTLLIRDPGPPSLDRERAMPRQMPPSPNILVFDEVLRDVTPPKPLYHTQYFHNRDLVKRHGYQFQEIRNVQIKKAILAQNLDELYVMWQCRPPHSQISEDKIETLKRSSRLIHHCAAPLLFHPEWRRQRSSTGPENREISPNESPTEEKREEIVERKISRVQKQAGEKKEETIERKISKTQKQTEQKKEEIVERKISRAQKQTEEKKEETIGRKTSKVHIHTDETKKERSVDPTKKAPPCEEAWHQELRSAYMQQYVQYMQSLQFIMVQTRPQSPKQSRRHLGRSAVSLKPRRESSPGDIKRQTSSKDRKDSPPKPLQCYLQRSSPGGIMLMELVFQGCFFIVRLYALGCSQIPSGKTVGMQMCRVFVEDCSRYREYIHLLSFNYDFHLCKAQLYLNGSQRIFNKGYGITHMLKGLLLEYAKCPVFARNRLCNGEISVPCHPGISPQAVFNYLVKNATKYDFSTLPLKTANSTNSSHVLLGTDRVLTNERNSGTKTYDILRDNNEYDISFVVSLKDSMEEGVVTMEYVVLMTSRREMFPKLTLDPRLTKKSPSSSSLSTISGVRKESFPEGMEQEKGSHVRFTVPSSDSSGFLVPYLPSPGEFHKSASSPHLGYEGGSQIFNVTASHSNENIAAQRRVSLPLAANYEESLPENVSQRESRLLTEAFLRARDHLVHIACRAQTHCNRDLLWHRLLAGEPEEEEKDGAKKTRRKSVIRKSNSELSLMKQSWMKSIETLNPGAEQASPPRLSCEEFKQLLSVVGSKPLKDEDPQLIPLLSMRASWYLNLFRVITAKFPDTHRSFTGEDSTVHYLAILNPDCPDMFVLLYVDENNDSAEISVVFREDLTDDNGPLHESRLLNKKTRSHVYSVINAMCFHLWTSLLPA